MLKATQVTDRKTGIAISASGGWELPLSERADYINVEWGVSSTSGLTLTEIVLQEYDPLQETWANALHHAGLITHSGGSPDVVWEQTYNGTALVGGVAFSTAGCRVISVASAGILARPGNGKRHRLYITHSAGSCVFAYTYTASGRGLQ
ncbi:MAG: hypothetical protein E6Q97_16170 [Desulfurellales bacterium]|nr:MAG: hypothetical protein E6Q97_16170 [Desulfurellales bacterium]